MANIVIVKNVQGSGYKFDNDWMPGPKAYFTRMLEAGKPEYFEEADAINEAFKLVPPGKGVLNGSINPDASIGTDGDFYLNTATKTFFGPKAAGAWPAGFSLVGPAGNTAASTTPFTPATPANWNATPANVAAALNEAAARIKAAEGILLSVNAGSGHVAAYAPGANKTLFLNCEYKDNTQTGGFLRLFVATDNAGAITKATHFGSVVEDSMTSFGCSASGNTLTLIPLLVSGNATGTLRIYQS